MLLYEIADIHRTIDDHLDIAETLVFKEKHGRQ